MKFARIQPTPARTPELAEPPAAPPLSTSMADKRRRSSSPLYNATKRAKIDFDGSYLTTVKVSDRFPTVEEVVHHIFSFLTPRDLCSIQRQ